MNIAEKWKQIRAELRRFFSLTPIDIAKNHGLSVEYAPELPGQVDGFLDRHEKPRFIAVNSKLHKVTQSYAICREISRFRQEQRLDSMVIRSTKRWKLLDEAPAAVKKQICELDLEHRALMMLGMWGDPAEYWTYHGRKPSKFFRTGAISLITDLLFLRLRLQRFYRQVN